MYRNRLAVSPGPGEPGWESLQSLDRLKELKVFKNYLHKDHSSGYLSAKEVFERNNQLEEEISQLKNTLAKIVDDLLSTNQEVSAYRNSLQLVGYETERDRLIEITNRRDIFSFETKYK